MDALTSIGAFNTNFHAQGVKQLKQDSSVANSTKAQIYEKAQELEGQFLSSMIEPLFSEGKESGLFGGGSGNDVFRGMMINEYGQAFSKAGGIGLADSIAKEMLALQEVE